MDIKIKTWLLDIQQSIDEIFLFLGDSRDFIVYKADLKTKKAVERNLEIIGEAANRLPDDFKDKHSNIDWHRIRGFRNRIVHDYFGIN